MPYNLSASPSRDRLILLTAVTVLRELFGKAGEEAKPLFLKNRTLTVTCATTDIAQAVRLKQLEILGKLNDKLGGREVDSIRYLT